MLLAENDIRSFKNQRIHNSVAAWDKRALTDDKRGILIFFCKIISCVASLKNR
jgi:hypothetical protein